MVDVALNGADVDTALRRALLMTGIQALGEHGAARLGAAYDLKEINYFIHKAGHGLLGGAIGALVSDDRQAGLVAGAMGAVVAEVVAEELFSSFQKSVETLVQDGRQSGRTYTKAQLEARLFTDLKIAVDTGKMAAALVSFLAEQDVQVSIDRATTAIENNFLLYTPRLINRFLDDAFLSRMEALAQVSFDVLVDLLQKEIPSDRYQGLAKGWNALLGWWIDVFSAVIEKGDFQYNIAFTAYKMSGTPIVHP